VPAFTVDSLLSQMGWADVDVLKVDIEGAEREVFESASWMYRVRACMVELHDHLQPGCLAAFERAVTSFQGRAVCGETIVAWQETSHVNGLHDLS
jgi:hypothetical protein